MTAASRAEAQPTPSDDAGDKTTPPASSAATSAPAAPTARAVKSVAVGSIVASV